MRDLGARLREIVRRERAVAAVPERPAAVRELVYVPDVEGRADHRSVARTGTPVDPAGACRAVDVRYPADAWHGRKSIEAGRPLSGAPLGLFDRIAAEDPLWWRHVVFFDIETTGLSGGAGTLAFLAGCGWFDDEGFVVRQFFLASPAGERALLAALGEVLEHASLLVSYNGRTFDVPFMETRWAFHRSSAPTDDVPHFDMLPLARRLWRRRDDGEETGCSLTTLERAVLGFHRHRDVSGFEIPARYFQFLRTGDVTLVEPVLEHNRHDLISLAGLMGHALWLAREGPAACRHPREQIALSRLYARAGDQPRAMAALEMAAALGDRDVRCEALARMAEAHRRQGNHDRAARLWEDVLRVDEPDQATGWARRAAEALAIHHEHRARDFETARQYARALETAVSPQGRPDVDRRLRRLERKLGRTSGIGSRLRYDG
jgi:DNA polymerase III epsilon subunit-like protein